MTSLVPFQFDTATVRVITAESGEILFIARDVAAALGYKDEADAITKHCKKAKFLKDVNSGKSPESSQINGLRSDTKLIPESDVYRLVMRSKLESAEKFQDWVVEEVIPSIRKTGSYNSAPLADPMKALNDPAVMRSLLLGYTEKVLVLEEVVKTLEPKAKAFDRVSTFAEGSYCIRDSAKLLQIEENKLKSWLIQHEWIYRRPTGGTLLGYSDKLKKGYLEHKLTTGDKTDGSGGQWSSNQVRITAHGLTKLSELLVAESQLELAA